MKRFIIISLLAAIAMPMAACLWVDSYNSYLFIVYDNEEFRERVDRVTRDNWKAYLGMPDDEYFCFDAEEVIRAAQAKGDDLMASYVSHLQQYLECAYSVGEENWEYPTKEQLGENHRKLSDIRLYASSKLKTRLRSQHALLFMRCNMLMGQHEENVRFWEGTAVQYIETVYKDMMKNIYAGALHHTGRSAEASEIFAEQGDWSSLMTIYYERRSYEAIRAEYERDANAAVLPFLLQDFVNNAQEAYDGQENTPGGYGGKLFIRDIERKEALQMIAFAGQVVAEGKTQQPALWMTARAWLEYLFADRRQALADIGRALTLDGNERQKDCARIIRFYITSDMEPVSPSYDDYLLSELQWLEEREETVKQYYNTAVRNRIMHQPLADKYTLSHRPLVNLALHAAVQSNLYEMALDTLDAKMLAEYLAYTKSPADNALERYLKSKAEMNEEAIADLIGTKYLQEFQWHKAIDWLEKVSVAYYNERGYAPYAALRKWTVEPWVRRQWLNDDEVWNEQREPLTFNPKLAFAKEMIAKEAGLNLLKGDVRCQRCYDLAVRYAQADITGDCWFILVDGKSTCDEAGAYGAKAVAMLREAAKAKKIQLRERALFALAYTYLNRDRWYEAEWNRETGDYDWIPQPAAQQYGAFAALVDFERQHDGKISDYVSRCDEYRQFVKHYK